MAHPACPVRTSQTRVIAPHTPPVLGLYAVAGSVRAVVNASSAPRHREDDDQQRTVEPCSIAAAPSAVTTVSRSTSSVRSRSAHSPASPSSQPPACSSASCARPRSPSVTSLQRSAWTVRDLHQLRLLRNFSLVVGNERGTASATASTTAEAVYHVEHLRRGLTAPPGPNDPRPPDHNLRCAAWSVVATTSERPRATGYPVVNARRRYLDYGTSRRGRQPGATTGGGRCRFLR